jgi:hypothetical protein
MQQAEIDQIINIITNFEDKRKFVPYFSDLTKHETFGPIFKNLPDDQKQEIENVIKNYIVEKIESMNKTK